MAAVAVLVVIAIAGIVLAGLRGRPLSGGSETVADPTHQDAAPPTPAPPELPGEAGSGPNQIVFAPVSDGLSAPAKAKVQRVAETAKTESRTVVIAAKIEDRGDRDEQMELAKKRASAVRQLLEASGMSTRAIRIEIAQMPRGLVTVREANRIELALR